VTKIRGELGIRTDRIHSADLSSSSEANVPVVKSTVSHLGPFNRLMEGQAAITKRRQIIIKRRLVANAEPPVAFVAQLQHRVNVFGGDDVSYAEFSWWSFSQRISSKSFSDKQYFLFF